MARWGKPTKNKKRGNPRYFLNETVEHSALFQRHEYITNTLGIMPLLSESGRAYYPSEMRSRILDEHLLFEGFFDRFNPINAIKKYGKEVGDLFASLFTLMKEPKYIPQYAKALVEKIIKPFIFSMEKFSEWLKSKNMPTFGAGVDKILNQVKGLINLEGWKKALTLTGAVIAVFYIKGKLKEIGLDLANFAKASKQVLNTAQNLLMKEFPKLATKLYGAAAVAASTGFVGWTMGAAAVLKVVNLAKDALKGALGRFRSKVGRIKRKEAASAAGDTGIVLNRDEDY